MARFQFKLATVLRQREMVEDACQRELAKLLRFQMILMNQLQQMQQTITQSKHDLADCLVGTVDLTRVGQFAGYSGQTAIKARQMVQQLALLQRQIDVARQRLLKATADRKAMELLRDRYHQHWLKEQNRRENAELDDLATRAYARRLAVGFGD